MRRAIPHLTLLLAASLALAGCAQGSGTPTPVASVASPIATTIAASPSGIASPGEACVPATTPPSRDWNQRTWYEVFVRSFADGDGDGIGDFEGLTARLDYLNDGDPATTTDLGVTGIWLMPIAASPSYHGYDVTDYRTVEPDYGTKADFAAFLAAAHDRGIAVIVDLVMNHTALDNPWFTESAAGTVEKADWYVWEDANPGWLGPDGQVVWHERGGRYYYAVFWDGMPDLNLRNAAVTRELESVARYWLDLGVDGFRLDAAKHLIEDGSDAQVNTPDTKAWLARFKASVDAVDPDALLVGEVYDTATTAGGYVPGSVDLTFDFALAKGIVLAVRNGRAAPLATGLGDTIRAWPPNQAASFLSNHDQNRIMDQVNGDAAAARLAAFTLFTSPGVPFIYYGEEIGMTGSKPDERIRAPMRWTAAPATAGFTSGRPWEPLSDDPPPVNVTDETGDPASLLTAYADLIRLRGQHVALREGGTTLATSDAEAVIGWLRTTKDETLLAVVNTSAEPVTGYSLGLQDGPLCAEAAATLVGSIGGDPGATVASLTVNATGGFDRWTPLAVLPPRSGYLISLAPAP